MTENKTTATTSQDPNEVLNNLARKLAELEAENARLKAAKGTRKVTLKVSEKGAVSLYGLGRFPITLYAGQWEALLAMVSAPKDNPLAKFIADNASKLSRKE